MNLTEGENNASNPKEEGGINLQKPTESKSTNTSKNIAVAIATNVLQKSISYTTGNIGKWTGSEQTQNAVNNMQKAIGYGIAIYANPIMGSIALAFDIGTNAIDYAYEQNQREIKRQILFNRTTVQAVEAR